MTAAVNGVVIVGGWHRRGHADVPVLIRPRLGECAQPTQQGEHQGRGKESSGHSAGREALLQGCQRPGRLAVTQVTGSRAEELGLQHCFQRLPQIGVLERVSAGNELGRFDALAAKQDFFGHLAEGKLCGESGDGEDGWP